MSCSCSCSCKSDGKQVFLYSCSGAADTGMLADRVMRMLMKMKVGKGSCLSGLGADLSGFIQSALNATNIVIDGCPVSCGKKNFERHNIPVTQFVMTDFGVKKGSTLVTENLIKSIANKIASELGCRLPSSAEDA